MKISGEMPRIASSALVPGRERVRAERVPVSHDAHAAVTEESPTASTDFDRGLQVAREAGSRARVRSAEENAPAENRGAAPGAVRFAQKMVHLVRDEMRAFARSNEELDEEQREAMQSALRDLRHTVRDVASQFTLADRSLDLEGFFGALATAVESYAERVSAVLTPAVEEDDGEVVEEPTEPVTKPQPEEPTMTEPEIVL